MSTHLDASGLTSQTTMLLSPGLSLRRSSYTGEKGPLSSTSSRFGFPQVFTSPPPSPGLPALVPRHGKPVPPPISNRRLFRLLLWLSGVCSILYFGFANIRLAQSVPSVGYSLQDGEEYEMVGEDMLPDYPTPVVISDKRGRAKWTVSIPPSYDFPLLPKDYADICKQSMEVATHVGDLHSHRHVQHAAHYGYYHVDANFMDVAEAIEHGMLPGVAKGGWASVGKEGTMVGEVADQLVENEVCETSLTFVMETGDAGLGRTLLALWMAYGLAKKEGRAFFVDDSRW